MFKKNMNSIFFIVMHVAHEAASLEFNLLAQMSDVEVFGFAYKILKCIQKVAQRVSFR